MKTKVHVVPSDGHWAVRISGDEEPKKICETQHEAVEAALKWADKEETDIVVHRQNGSFRNVIGYDLVEQKRSQQRRDSLISACQIGAALGALAAIGAAAFVLSQNNELRRRLRPW